MSGSDNADQWVCDLVRACGFAVATAEFGLAGRIPPATALEDVAAALDAVLQRAGLELRLLARLEAVSPGRRRDS